MEVFNCKLLEMKDSVHNSKGLAKISFVNRVGLIMKWFIQRRIQNCRFLHNNLFLDDIHFFKIKLNISRPPV